ncbi:MAG: sigma-70 family RNA polymerase sigma factor [Acidobacteriota bacterium]
MSHADERRLLEALAAGDRSAAEALARGSYTAVFRSLTKLCGDPELAADLTQETFRRAWAALPQFDGRARFSTWLYRIAYNTFISFQRRPKLLAPLEEDEVSRIAAEGPRPDREVERAQKERRLRTAVLELPDTLRLAVTARFWGEVPVLELARLEGVTGPAIRKRLRRAEKILRRALKEHAS